MCLVFCGILTPRNVEEKEVACGGVIWSELLEDLYFLSKTPVEDCRSKPFVLAQDSKICCLYKFSSQSCSFVSRIYIILHCFVLFICSFLDSIFCFAIRRSKI